MIKEILELYCDECEIFIANLKNEREKRDHIHAEGFERNNTQNISFRVFCKKECKQEYYKRLKADKIIEEI